MLVSVIVPIYNSERYIERCVKSLFEQTYSKDIEYIFVDDGSTDNSIKILNEVIDRYNKRVIVTIKTHDKNMGCAMARKTGMNAANGDYVIQVDSDDYVATDYLEKLVNKAIADDADIVVCNYYRIQKNDQMVEVSIPQFKDNTELLCQFLAGNVHNGLWNKLMRRSLYVDNDIYPVEGVNMYDDKSVICRVTYFAKKISYIPEILYYYNRNNPQSISSQDMKMGIKPGIKLLGLLREFFADKENNSSYIENINNYGNAVKGAILLHECPKIIKQHSVALGKTSLKAIIRHRKLPLYYRLIVSNYQMKLMPFVWIEKGVFQGLKHLKSLVKHAT